MKNALQKLIRIGAAAAFPLAWVNVAWAQANGDNGTIILPDPLNGQTFLDVANNIIWFIQADIATPLCVIMALVGGFQLMSSAGSPEKVSQGRKTILWAAVGYAIVLIAGGLASLLKTIINGS